MNSPAIKYVMLKSKVISAHTSSPTSPLGAVCLLAALSGFVMVGTAGLCQLPAWTPQVGSGNSAAMDRPQLGNWWTPQTRCLPHRLLHTLCPQIAAPSGIKVGLPSPGLSTRMCLRGHTWSKHHSGRCPVPGLNQATASCFLVFWSLLDVTLWWNKK